jgi:uncharacterized protein YjiS (DUF1127 family)
MTSLHLTADRHSLSGTVARREHWLARGWATLGAWLARSRDRRALAELDDFMLKDIGMTRADVVVESGKHFWQR